LLIVKVWGSALFPTTHVGESEALLVLMIGGITVSVTGTETGELLAVPESVMVIVAL